MGSEKVTMVLNADLKCSKCFKKIKKILCKIPEIQDQAYDEKTGKVTIKVATSNPEKIKQKILSKDCGCIKSVEIKAPDKPKPPALPSLSQSIAIGVSCQQPVSGYPCFRGCGGQCGGRCGNCDGNCGRRCGGQCGGGCSGRSCGQCDGSCCGRRCGGQCDGNCRKKCCANQCNTPFWCEENPKGGCATM